VDPCVAGIFWHWTHAHNTHTHTYTQTYTHIPTRTGTHAHTQTHTHIHTNTHTHTHTHTHIHTNTHTHLHTHTRTYTHAQAHTNTYTYTHTLTPTHTKRHKHIHTLTQKHTHTHKYAHSIVPPRLLCSQGRRIPESWGGRAGVRHAHALCKVRASLARILLLFSLHFALQHHFIHSFTKSRPGDHTQARGLQQERCGAHTAQAGESRLTIMHWMRYDSV